MEGADLGALAAAGTQLLVNHVHAGLGILGDGTSLTGLGTLAALDADIGLCGTVFVHDLDAGFVLVELLVESGGAGTDALQACHAGGTLFDAQFFHSQSPFFLYISPIIQDNSQNSNRDFIKIQKN